MFDIAQKASVRYLVGCLFQVGRSLNHLFVYNMDYIELFYEDNHGGRCVMNELLSQKINIENCIVVINLFYYVIFTLFILERVLLFYFQESCFISTQTRVITIIFSSSILRKIYSFFP